MKRIMAVFASALWIAIQLTVNVVAADGAKPAADPFAGAFFSPELVMLTRGQLALTADQEQTLRECMEKTQRRGEELRAKSERETTALAALAKQPQVDEAAMGAQLDRVLDVEREAKHVQLGLLMAVRILLTPQQQAQFRNIETASQHVPEKIERVKEIAQAWEKAGRDTSSIAMAMDEKVRPLVEAGKFIEAETELNRPIEQFKAESERCSAGSGLIIRIPRRPDPDRFLDLSFVPGEDARGQPLVEKAISTERPQLRIQKKMMRVRDGIERWHKSGKDPSAIGELMKGAQPLADGGKLDELEKLVDQALEMLGESEKTPHVYRQE